MIRGTYYKVDEANIDAERSSPPPLAEGDLVEIYQFPLTDLDPEGIARLVRPLSDVGPVTGYQDWLVTFLDDDDGGEYRRTVHPRHRCA